MMVRRSTPRAVLDETSFPVRLALLHSGGGQDGLRWTELEVWLVENVGRGNFATHGITKHRPYAMGIYLRTVEDARRFVEAFPDRALADSTETVEHLRLERLRAGSEKQGAQTPQDGNGLGGLIFLP